MKSNKPDISLLRKYLDGELDARAMYEIERQAQDDPLLMDVMQGMENGKRDVDETHLNEISWRIKQRAGMQAEGRKGVKLFPWKTWTAAASLVFAFLMAGLWLFRTPEKIQLHQSTAAVQKPVAGTSSKTEAPSVVPELKLPMVSDSESFAVNKPASAKSISKRKSLPEVAAEPASLSIAMAAPGKALNDSASADRMLKEAATTYSAQNIPADTLSRVLSGKVAGLQVMKRTSATVVSGVVKDKDDHEPVSGAVVRLKGNKKAGTLTDAQGRFSIPLSSKNETLEVTALGFDHQQVQVDSAGYLSIALVPNHSELSEVIVTSMGSRNKRKNASPEIGWKAYAQYVEDEGTISSGKQGKVTLTFKIDKDGRPVSVKIVKGLTDDLDLKAIKIITDGPKWNRDIANPDKEVTLKIKFHY